MKIAISATSGDLQGEVAEFFGRCPFFLLVEMEDGKILRTEVLENKSNNGASGAGILAAQLLAENKVDWVIAQNIGPRALDVLAQFDIKTKMATGVMETVLNDFLAENNKK